MGFFIPFIDTAYLDEKAKQAILVRTSNVTKEKRTCLLTLEQLGKGSVVSHSLDILPGLQVHSFPLKEPLAPGRYLLHTAQKNLIDQALDYRFVAQALQPRRIFIDPLVTEDKLKLALQSKAVTLVDKVEKAEVCITRFTEVAKYTATKANLIILANGTAGKQEGLIQLSKIGTPTREPISQSLSDLAEIKQAFLTPPVLPADLIATPAYDIIGYHIPIFKTLSNQPVLSLIPLGGGRQAMVIQTGLDEKSSNLALSEYFVPTLLSYLTPDQSQIQLYSLRLPQVHKSASEVVPSTLLKGRSQNQYFSFQREVLTAKDINKRRAVYRSTPAWIFSRAN